MFKPGEVLNNRYLIKQILGRGGLGITYTACDNTTRQTVVIKCLHLHRLNEWKSFELFEREAKVLKNLDHPFIPAYIDYFEWGKQAEKCFIPVMEYIPGINLLQKVQEGWHGTEVEIKEIAVKLLKIVEYLAVLHPPIIHRDINPKNIILHKNGDLYLVDFGCVKDVLLSQTSTGSTIVGTPGFIPIEQFQG